jgi:hypothetical protein
MFRLPSFDRAFRRLTRAQRPGVNAVVQQIPGAVGHPHRHAGLGLRIRFLVDQGDFFLATVGNHDQIRRYIKNNR